MLHGLGGRLLGLLLFAGAEEEGPSVAEFGRAPGTWICTASVGGLGGCSAFVASACFSGARTMRLARSRPWG